MSSRSDEVKSAAKSPAGEPEEIRRKDLLSTGSTLLNLACSNCPFGGFLRGHYYFLVGDSASGKTWISMTCFAEASHNSRFKDYRLIYDNVEGGALFDVERYFGRATAEKVESPGKDEEGRPRDSQTIEDFYFHVDDAIRKGKPFIYVLDSMDALSSQDEAEKFAQQKEAHRKGKEVPGSYGDGKAKKNSAGIRQLLGPLKQSGSILIIINQTRDNIGFGAQFNPKTRSGGHALRFYATVEMWSSVKGKIKKTIKGKARNVGVLAEIRIKKNRITGQEHVIEVPFYPSYGLDDMGSCVQYLIDEEVWGQKGPIVHAPEIDYKGTMEALIRHIEEKGLERKVQALVGKTWNEVLEASALRRKRRYE